MSFSRNRWQRFFPPALVIVGLASLSVAGIDRAFAADAPPATAPAASTRPAQTPILAENTVLSADVPYGGPDAKLNVLDVYAPKDVKNAPVLLFIHGGEWSRGDKKDVSYKPQFFNSHNILFIAANYRLSPKDPHPAQVDDVATVIAWAKQHVADYGGDPNKIVIMGHSAGCHLVTLVTLDPQYLAKVHLKPTDVRATVSWSGGMFDLVARANGGGMYSPFINATFGEASADQQAASPKTYVKNAGSCPPFMFASVDDDHSKTSRAASDDMVQEIKDNGGHAESRTLTGKSHFTANHELGAPGDSTGPMLLQFIMDSTK